MSTTGRDLVKGALKIIGVAAPGESISADQQSEGIITLNDMLSSWSTESLVIFSKTIEDFNLVGSQQTYTMGSGGDWDTTRPQKVFHLATLDAGSNPTQEIPVEIISFDQWSDIHQKGTTGTYATKCYIDFSNPLVSFNFWPVSTLTNQMRVYSWKPLTAVTENGAVDLPPGYDLALKYNLAILLSVEYGRPLLPEMASIAATAKANIERMNAETPLMGVDAAIVGNAYFDWRTGESR